MREKLKPCPFCGKTPVFIQRDCQNFAYDIGCGSKNCLLRDGADWYLPKHEIIEKWNKRIEYNNYPRCCRGGCMEIDHD